MITLKSWTSNCNFTFGGGLSPLTVLIGSVMLSSECGDLAVPLACVHVCVSVCVLTEEAVFSDAQMKEG